MPPTNNQKIRILITSDWTSIDVELDRLLSLPNEATKAKLEKLLVEITEDIRDVTPVRTGSLQGSERAEILPPQNANQWVGQFHAGGPSPGFLNDPVTYAAYVRAGVAGKVKARDGAKNNFMAGAYVYTDMFAELIREELQGGE